MVLTPLGGLIHYSRLQKFVGPYSWLTIGYAGTEPDTTGIDGVEDFEDSTTYGRTEQFGTVSYLVYLGKTPNLNSCNRYPLTS